MNVGNCWGMEGYPRECGGDPIVSGVTAFVP